MILPLAAIVYWGYIGRMEKNMEATLVHCGYIGIMEKKMEATIVHRDYIGIMEVLHVGVLLTLTLNSSLHYTNITPI